MLEPPDPSPGARASSATHSPLQFGKLTLLVARDPVAIKGLLNRVRQILVDEWLGQELYRAGFDGFHRHRNITVPVMKMMGMRIPASAILR